MSEVGPRIVIEYVNALPNDLRSLAPGTRIDENVRGLKVSVNDSLLVAVMDGVAHLCETAKPIAQRKLFGMGVVGDRLAVGDVFHHEVRHAACAIIVGACVMHTSNALVLKARQHISLEAESPKRPIGGDSRTHKFDRDGPVADRDASGRARDEARLVADYERCGQHCCCKSFLKVLKPVPMRAAKLQKATLDPLKISGRCGRLMCCLRYEDET